MPAADLQAIAPNRVRARTIALFLLLANVISFKIAPTDTALISDYVLRAPRRIGVAVAPVAVTRVTAAGGPMWSKSIRHASDL